MRYRTTTMSMSRHLPPPHTDLSAYGGSSSKHHARDTNNKNFTYGDEINDDDDDTNIANKDKSTGELKRRCIDYHTPSILDVSSRLYRKPNKRLHAIPGGSGLAGYPYIQCHTNYLRHMGLSWGEGGTGGNVIPSCAFLTYCAHVTRAKNSNPVM